MVAQPLVIDAGTGKVFSAGTGLLNVIGRAKLSHGVNQVNRADGTVTRVLTPDRFDAYRKRCDSQFIVDLAKSEGRTDSDFGGNAGGFPRDFEHIYKEILAEKRAPLNYTKQMRMDGRVPLGAKTHTVRRRLGTGDAAIYRGGTTGIPVVGHSFVEEQFPVIYIVSAVETNWFELISDSFEGRNQFADDSRMAVRAIEERINNIAFNAVPDNASTAAKLIIQDLNAASNFAIENSGGTFRPTRMVTSIRRMNFLMQTQNSVATDKSIGQFWLDGQPDIKTIEGVRELRGIGPAGEDGMMFYDDNLTSTAFVMIQPPTAMPAHSINSFQNQTVYVAAIGGTIMRDVGNNNLLLTRN